MTKLRGSQLSLITEIEEDDSKVGDWHYDQLGTEQILVPNSAQLKLGTEEILVPNFSPSELGTDKWTPPNYDDWKPPIGCLDRKWIKSHQYWCWRYYDNEGKKRSIHLHKDYNKAVRKAIKIGVPTDAKLPNLSASCPQTQTQTPTTDNLIDLPPTAHSTSRNCRAA